MKTLFRKEAIENKRENLYGDVIVIKRLSFTFLALFTALICAAIIAFLIFG